MLSQGCQSHSDMAHDNVALSDVSLADFMMFSPMCMNSDMMLMGVDALEHVLMMLSLVS